MNLLMINGPCGVGKSETSLLLAESILGAELVQTDALRKTIPEDMFLDAHDRPDAIARMWQANVIGRDIAKKALLAGRSVVVDSIKYQHAWVEPWEDFGHELGARVLDVCIIAPKPVVEERALKRGYRPDGRLTPAKVSALYDAVAEFYKNRPAAIIIDNQHLSPVGVASRILSYTD